MRKKFILFVLIPLLVMALVVWFFIDRWLESGLEAAGEALVGARVEIDHLHLSLLPLAIRFDRLQVASTDDSLANLFETGTVHYGMDMSQLLRGKTIIDIIQVSELVLGTRRNSSGFLPLDERARESFQAKQYFTEMMDDVLQRTKATTPLFDPALWRGSMNIDSLIKAQNFRSLALIDSLKRATATASVQWDSTLAVLNKGKADLEEIKTSVQQINPKELKRVDEITSAIATVDKALKTFEELRRSGDERYKAASGSVQQLATSVGTIDEAVAGDMRQLLAQARLPDLNTMNLAELLVGPTILTDAKKATHWIDITRHLVQRYKPAPELEKPKRWRGQDIHFPVQRGYPEFWIKQIRISGGTDKKQHQEYIHLQGTINNYSSDQHLAGEPFSVELQGSRGDHFSASLSVLCDRRTETSYDQYKASVSGVRLGGMPLGKADFLPAVCHDAELSANLAVTIPGQSFSTEGKLALRSLHLAFQQEPRNIGERLARDVLAGVNSIDAGFKIWQADKGLEVAFKTDLDEQFLAGIKRVLGAELIKMQNQLREGAEKEFAAKRAEFEKYFALKKDEVQKQLDGWQNQVNEIKRLGDEKRKELETRLAQVKKGAVDQVKDKLFKKK
jgi:uncharacterized protein (TIGR03545 family)